MKKNNKKCLIENCNNKYRAKGYCNKHYRYFKDMLNISNNKCSVLECIRGVIGKGFCSKHLKRYNNHNTIELKSIKYGKADELKSKNGKCEYNNCNKKNKIKGILFKTLSCSINQRK